MRVLTLFTAIFIPITFIAGIFGMNFEPLPGSDTPGGFWICTAAMALVTAAQFTWWHRQGWLHL